MFLQVGVFCNSRPAFMLQALLYADGYAGDTAAPTPEDPDQSKGFLVTLLIAVAALAPTGQRAHACARVRTHAWPHTAQESNTHTTQRRHVDSMAMSLLTAVREASPRTRRQHVFPGGAHALRPRHLPETQRSLTGRETYGAPDLPSFGACGLLCYVCVCLVHPTRGPSC